MAAIRFLVMNWVRVIAVNMEITTPSPRVMAKPLMLPVPKQNSTAEAIIVVILESKIVVKAREKPASMDSRNVLPLRYSSLKCSKISTLASTAIPMDRIIPATPGKVRVASRSFRANSRIITYAIRLMSATMPDTR